MPQDDNAEWGKSGGSGIGKSLKKPIFGMPAWALAFILAALFIAVMVYRNRKQNAAKAAAAQTNDPNAPSNTASFDPNAVDPTSGLLYSQEMPSGYGLPAGAIGSYLNNDATNPAYPTGLTEQGLPGPVTNLQWSRLVADSLAAKGDDPVLVENALAKYLSGKSLTAAETSIERLAIEMFGSPPEGVIPSTPATTTGKQDWYYTAKSGDTWTSIAKIAFPNATFAQQQAAASAIAAQNQSASLPTLGGQPGPNSLIRIGTYQDWVNAGFESILNKTGTGIQVTNTGHELTPPWGTQ